MAGVVLLDSEFVDARMLKDRPDLFQGQLGKAKRLENAKCYCVPDHPIDMVVRQLQNGRILASWPGSLKSHAPECPFWGQSVLAPALQVGGNSIPQQQCEIVYRDGWTFGSVSALNRGSEAQVQVDLQWLLAELWQSSMLNSWSPEWRRDWSLIKRRIASAAERMTVNAESLGLHLHVVESFTAKKKSVINNEWDGFVAPLVGAPFNLVEGADGQQFKIALVLGELNSARISHGTWVLQLRNHFEVFGLVPEASASIGSRLTSKLQQLSFGAQFRPVVMMCVAVDDLGLFHVLDMTLMEVGSRWLPGTLNIEKDLVQFLVESGYEIHITKAHKWGGGLPYLICRKGMRQPWIAIYTYATSMSLLKVQQYQTKMLSDPVNIRRKCVFVGYDHPIHKMLAGL